MKMIEHEHKGNYDVKPKSYIDFLNDNTFKMNITTFFMLITSILTSELLE